MKKYGVLKSGEKHYYEICFYGEGHPKDWCFYVKSEMAIEESKMSNYLRDNFLGVDYMEECDIENISYIREICGKEFESCCSIKM